MGLLTFSCSNSILPGSPVTKVWIVGHNIVFWADIRLLLFAGMSNGHSGTAREWLGRRGMLWRQLFPFLSCSRRALDLLVLHLEENDLPHTGGRLEGVDCGGHMSIFASGVDRFVALESVE